MVHLLTGTGKKDYTLLGSSLQTMVNHPERRARLKLEYRGMCETPRCAPAINRIATCGLDGAQPIAASGADLWYNGPASH
jgi:hypothetical protein